MADTLQTMTGYLRLQCPSVPLGLAQGMIKNGYRELLDWPTDGWSFQFGQSQMVCHQSIMGQCYMVQGSNMAQNVVPTNGIAAFTIGNPGLSYAAGDLVYPIGFSSGWLTVLTVDGSGRILTASLTNPGANFTLAQNVTTYSSGNATGATINVTALGNGALPGLASIIAGRQAIFGGQWPCYDIVDNPSANTFTISSAYGGVTGIVGFEITNVYWTPTDPNLERLMCITDPPNECQLPTSFTFEELNNIDAQRSQAGTPYLLADLDINTAYLAALPNGVVDSFGQTNQSQAVLRKEIYPRQQANYAYPYFYKKWIPDLTPANPNPISYFSRRGDIVVRRAMADLALWEGPEILGKKSNPVASNIYMSQFRQMAQDLQIKDQSMFQRSYGMWLQQTKWPYPEAYMGSGFCQIHPQVGSDMSGSWSDLW